MRAVSQPFTGTEYLVLERGTIYAKLTRGLGLIAFISRQAV